MCVCVATSDANSDTGFRKSVKVHGKSNNANNLQRNDDMEWEEMHVATATKTPNYFREIVYSLYIFYTCYMHNFWYETKNKWQCENGGGDGKKNGAAETK